MKIGYYFKTNGSWQRSTSPFLIIHTDDNSVIKHNPFPDDALYFSGTSWFYSDTKGIVIDKPYFYKWHEIQLTEADLITLALKFQ